MGAELLASWPWDNLGSYKYVLYGPLVGKAVASRTWEAASPDRWILLLLVLFGLRALTYQLWSSFSNMLFATRRRRIVRDGVDFEQIDKEWDWDNFLILQILMAATAFYTFPSLRHLPLWDARGFAVALLLHVAATEPLFYAAHRAFHASGRLFARYHSLHHSSRVPLPFTAGLATPLEHMVLGALMSAPLAGAAAAGVGSVSLAFGYVLGFDFLRAMGHCNVEVFPSALFQTLPVLRYLIYTPTYHTIHHTKKEANFCLFMPLFDLLGGTLDDQSWEMQKQTSAGAGVRVPGTRGGRDAVAPRALRAADLRVHALLRAALPAAHVALRLPRHAHDVGLVQDLRHLLLQPPRPPAPDLGRPQIRLPVLFALCEGRNQQADRACHSEGRQDGRQGPQPCSSQQERGAERRRHAVREQAPGPPRARRPRQHPNRGGDPERDPQGHLRGVPHRRHVQARQGHRSVPVQEEGPRHDDDAVDGAVPEDPEGGADGVPAVPGAGHQVPLRAALQDVDRREVAVAAGAAVGAVGHALPPVRGAAHHRLPPGLHLRQARRHAPPRGRPGPRHLRVLAGARGGARVPRGRRLALPGGVYAPRGGRHRRRPHRRRVGGSAQARPPASLIELGLTQLRYFPLVFRSPSSVMVGS